MADASAATGGDYRGYDFTPNGVNIRKQLRITGPNGEVGAGVAMILDDTVDFRVKSNFSTMEDVLSKFKVTSALLSGYEKMRSIGQLSGSDILSGKAQPLDIPVWTGSDPLDFTINVSFFTMHGGGEKMMRCVKELMAMQLPTEDGLLLRSPVPQEGVGAFFNPSSYSSSGPKTGYLTFYIGNIATIEQVLITNVSPTFSTEIDTMGFPIQIELSIDARTRLAASKDMITSAFKA